MLPKNAWLAASGFLLGSDKGTWKSPQQPQAWICAVNSLKKNRCLQRYKGTSTKRKVKWKELHECNSSISINNFLEFLWFLSEYLPAQLLQWCFFWHNPGKTKARELLLTCNFSFFSEVTAIPQETKVQEINNPFAINSYLVWGSIGVSCAQAGILPIPILFFVLWLKGWLIVYRKSS